MKIKLIELMLDNLRDEGPELYNEIAPFYLEHIEHSKALECLKKEIALRTGRAIAVDKFIEVDKLTKQEAKEYAIKYHGEYLGIATVKAHHFYIIPYTVEELREKLSKRRNSFRYL